MPAARRGCSNVVGRESVKRANNCCAAYLAVLAIVGWSANCVAQEEGLRQAVEADWNAQERRLGRTPENPAAIHAAYGRAQSLVDSFQKRLVGIGVDRAVQVLDGARRQVAGLEALNKAERLSLWKRLRWATRDLALQNPLVANRPIVFMKRHRFVCQMLHEYLGYYYDYGNVAGGGIEVLERPGFSFETRDLIRGRLPRGNFTTMALSYDAHRVYFAFADRAEAKPEFYSAERRTFHVFAVNADGSDLRQLTHGGDDDFDPCPLPDGGLAFISSRRGGFGRCHNPWEPLPTYTLHRMNEDGSGIKTLSWHETNEWHPFVMNDGRIIYTRWDYVDRSAANFHGLWLSNPDGSNPVSLFGNYTTRINACYQPRAIPGSRKVVFVAGAHHADVGGSLVLVDPLKVSLDPETGEDALTSIELLTPEVCFAESDGWPKSYFHGPWPLSEDYYLVAFSFDPLPGMSAGEERDTRTGLYYFDRWGNLELLYRDPGASAMYPIPLAPRAAPPIIPEALDPQLGEEGEFLVQDVRRSLLPMPEGRPITDLLIFQVLPKTPPHVANQPRLGYANAESARMLLGTVPVEADGSAYFRAPARKPVYFQTVDASGKAVQTMRSVTYLQPGERRGCIGCHETPRTAAGIAPNLAARRPPSRIEPGPDGSRPLSFPRLVQPVLDRHCVRCHDGSSGAETSALTLTGTPAKTFTQAYDNLKPFVRWFEWGDASISQAVTRPGHSGASESHLSAILDDAQHRPIQIPDEDRRKIYLWLDANAPFFGTYGEREQLAQHSGEAVPIPSLQ